MADNEKAEGGQSKELTKFLIMTLASIVIMFIVFAGVNYVIMENLISQKISALPASQEELADDSGDEDEVQKGIIVDLGDFILNLCDESQKKYLKVNVALEVTIRDAVLQIFQAKLLLNLQPLQVKNLQKNKLQMILTLF